MVSVAADGKIPGPLEEIVNTVDGASGGRVAYVHNTASVLLGPATGAPPDITAVEIFDL